jgi:hypothetical protein
VTEVLRVVARVRHWWAAKQQPTVNQVPFEVACVCGTAVKGFRRSAHQVVACPACRHKVFVLPISPLPPVSPITSARASSAVMLRSHPLWQWRWPIAVAAVSLAIVVAVFIGILNGPWRSPSQSSVSESLHRHIEAGRQALEQGKFRLAVEEFETVQTLRERHRETILSAAERGRLTQWQRQAGLLADLLSNSLEDILRDAAEWDRDEKTWQRIFAERYRGKAVVFDSEVFVDHTGRPQIAYTVFFHDKRATLDLSNVELIGHLPLQNRQRWLFGLRLAGVRLEAEGTWVIRFEPASGVLLTDLGAAAACCLQPAEELKDVVGRQAEWLANSAQ